MPPHRGGLLSGSRDWVRLANKTLPVFAAIPAAWLVFFPCGMTLLIVVALSALGTVAAGGDGVPPLDRLHAVSEGLCACSARTSFALGRSAAKSFRFAIVVSLILRSAVSVKYA